MAKKKTQEQAPEHSPKFEVVKNYYDSGLWKKKAVRNAVTTPKIEWRITAEEYEEITGEPYAE